MSFPQSALHDKKICSLQQAYAEKLNPWNSSNRSTSINNMNLNVPLSKSWFPINPEMFKFNQHRSLTVSSECPYQKAYALQFSIPVSNVIPRPCLRFLQSVKGDVIQDVRSETSSHLIQAKHLETSHMPWHVLHTLSTTKINRCWKKAV